MDSSIDESIIEQNAERGASARSNLDESINVSVRRDESPVTVGRRKFARFSVLSPFTKVGKIFRSSSSGQSDVSSTLSTDTAVTKIKNKNESTKSTKKTKKKKWFMSPEPKDSLEALFLRKAIKVSKKVCNTPLFTTRIVAKKVGIDLRAFDFAAILTNYFLVIRDCSNIETYISSTITMLSQIFKTSYSEMFQRSISLIINYFSLLFFRVYRCKSMKQTESFNSETLFNTDVDYKTVNDFFRETGKLCKEYDKICKGEFAARMSAFMSLIICIPFVERNELLKKVGYNNIAIKAMKKAHRETNSVTWIVSLIETTSFIISKSAEVAYYKDLRRLISDVDEVSEYEERYNKMLYLVDHMDTIERHNTTLKEFLCEVASLGELNLRLREYSRDAARGKMKADGYIIKRCQYRVLEKLNVMSQRDPPIAIVFNGPPGAGKTNIVDVSLKVMYDIAVANGHCTQLYSPEMKYTYNWSSEFLSGWRISSKVMLIDDVGQWTKDITVANKGGALVHFIDWVNGTPHITNQAELENKGTIPMLAEYVIMTTNFDDAGFSNVFQATGGAWRRPYFIQTCVQPQYRKPESQQLAGDEEDEYNADLHYYLPYRYDIDGNAKHKLYWHHGRKKWIKQESWPSDMACEPYMTFQEMNEFYRDVVVNPHYATIAKSKAMMKKVFEGGPCSVCKGSTVMCSCASVGPVVEADYAFLASDAVLFSSPGDPVIWSPEGVVLNSDDSSSETEDGEEAVIDGSIDQLSEDEKNEMFELHGKPNNVARAFDLAMIHVLFPVYAVTKRLYFFESTSNSLLVYLTAFHFNNYHPIDNFGKDYLSGTRKKWGVYLSDQCSSRGVDFWNFMDKMTCSKALIKLGFQSMIVGLGALVSIFIFMSMMPSSKKEEDNDEEKQKSSKFIRVKDDSIKKPKGKPETEAGFSLSALKEISNKDNFWTTTFEPITVYKGAPSTITKEDLINVCSRNIIRLELKVKDSIEHTHIFGIYGDVAVVNKHFYKAIENNLPIRFAVIASEKVNVGPNTKEVILDSSNFYETKGFGDLMLIQHPRLGTFRDVRKFMIDTFVTGKNEGYLLRKDEKGCLDVVPVHAFQKEWVSYEKNIPYGYHGYGAKTVVHTKNGDCGSPYIVGGRNGWCIAGFHCAGCISDPPYKNIYAHPLFSNWDFSVENISPLSYDGIDLAESLCTPNIIGVHQNLHEKDPIRNLESGNFRIYGTLDVPRSRFYSTVGLTKYHKEVMEYFQLSDMKYASPRTVSTRECLKLNLNSITNKPTFPMSLVNECGDHLFNIFVKVLNENSLWKYIPDKKFDLYVGINGVDKIPHMERLVTKTSSGFPHKGPKLKHLVELEPDELHSLKYDFDKVIRKEYDYGVAKMLEGNRPNVIWDFNFKDEPISVKKLEENNVRIFNSAPVWFSTLERQCFLWCIPLFYGKFRHKFGMAMGANAVGEDWTILYEYLMELGPDHAIAGDYKKFDKGMPPELIMKAFDILIRIAIKSGFPEEDIKLMKGVATEVSYPITNCLGTLVGFYGSNPSGHPLTTVVNSIVNILYIMMAAKTIEAELGVRHIDYDNFFDYVKILTFGDDNIMTSSIDYINHTNISGALGRYGVVYTMAEKDKESIPFIHLTEATFLKRKFAPDVHKVGKVAAPLDEESIIKSLLIFKRSDSITVQEQNAASIYSACREYFQYGEDVFEERRDFLNGILHRYSLMPYVPTGKLPTYQELLDWRFK